MYNRTKYCFKLHYSLIAFSFFVYTVVSLISTDIWKDNHSQLRCSAVAHLANSKFNFSLVILSFYRS